MLAWAQVLLKNQGVALGSANGFAAPPHVLMQQGNPEWNKTLKWPKKSDIPVAPLDPETEEGIQNLLLQAGGVLPLGKISQEFPGVKRMQLQGIFDLGLVGQDGQIEVRLPGCESTGAEIMFQGQGLSKEQAFPPLDADSVELIRNALEQEPGHMLPIAKIKEVVPGVNKKQLEDDFDVIRVNKKHFNIALKSELKFTPPGGQLRAMLGQRLGAPQQDPAAKRQRIT